MNSRFLQAATSINFPDLEQWKDEGKPVIGYSCSYVPSEIFHAAGILSMRLRGIETEGMEIGDSYFGPYICSFPKCILQLAGHGKFSMLDGVVITPGCDSMRRLYECWQKAGEDYDGIVPGFFHYLDVPHKTVSHRIDWFVDEITALKIAVEEKYNLRIDQDKINASIEVHNTGRKLMDELEGLRRKESVPLSGSEAFAVAVAGTVMWRDDFNNELKQYVENLKTNATDTHKHKKRLMLIGSISDDIELVSLVESNNKAVVVADNLCFGVRQEENEISINDDPLRALARFYLGESTCPRMFGKYGERLTLMKKKIETCKVDGVILQNIRFCDLHGSENGLFERDLEKVGVPCLKLEREYGPLTETGRIKMRIDAFLERIS